MFKESVEFNLSTFLPQINVVEVSGAAFCKARYKIDLSFFKNLNRILTDYHQSLKEKKYWKGFQLIAGDGTTALLPSSPQIKNYFGLYSSTHKGTTNCLAQIFMLYDVYDQVVLSGRISKMDSSEKSLFKQVLDEFPKSKAIFLLDRGFGYFNICQRLLSEKRDFCIRMDHSHSLFAKKIMAHPSDDFLVDWVPSDREKITSRRNEQDKKPIQVRVSKIKLDSGETEVLISSLYNFKTFTLSDIKQLYRLRWGVEEGFKNLKSKMKLEYFGSRKPEGIFQEFEAHIFMMNLVGIIGKEAQRQVDKRTNNRRLEYKYNWQNAFRFIRMRVADLLSQSPKRVQHILDQLVAWIMKSTIAIKENRSFPRNTFRKNKSRHHQCYK